MDANRLQQIEELYHAAREDRAVLDKADPELRREVEALLAQDSLAGPLEQPPMEVAAKLLADSMVTPLVPGTQLGPYRIEATLGAGGMGQVYRAVDTRLDRKVAIKIASKQFSERFEREARAISSLNHPHICTLYDVGPNYLVMELVEGETLAARLKKGKLSIDDTLLYGGQITAALAEAHSKGIIHRDLKPGNIMLTKSGAKLLDFGLAKLRQEASPVTSLSQRPTAESTMTAEGTILGTLQYMAPEQVEGKTSEIDARTDIFAFGAVVYEMATGKKAFEGKSQASLIAEILETEPAPMSSLQPMTPPALDRAVKICLAKQPDQRWQTASDLCRELKWIAESSGQAAGISITAARPKNLSKTTLWAGAAVVACVVAGVAGWMLKPTPASPKPVTRTVINLPPGQQLAGLPGLAVALSADGAHLAYVARQRGTQQIYLRAMDSLEAKPILGTQGGVEPFFSPDGRSLGFFAAGKLKVVSLNGGVALTLADAGFPWGASWGSQGRIVFAHSNATPLQQVLDRGGAAQQLTRLEKPETIHFWPEFLPGGKAVLFAAGTVALKLSNAQVAVQVVGTGEHRNLIAGAANPRYATSGHLVYAQGGYLMAAPFDPRRLVVTGAAVPVVEGVMQSFGFATQYSVSVTGSLVYVPAGVQQPDQSKLVWVSRNGAEQPLAAPAHSYSRPRLSPDGGRLAVTILESDDQLRQEPNVWLYDLSRETLTRFTFEGNSNQWPVWTPDGKRITFQSNKDGPVSIFWQLTDSSGGLERLTTSEFIRVPMSWSQDAQLLAFQELNPVTLFDVWVLRLGDRTVQPFLRTQFNESASAFSRDGHWLAYNSDESGRFEVYVQPYPGPGEKYPISTEGGTEPVWNPNGKELFYRSGDKMMAVDITTQPSFSVGKPRMLFQGTYLPGDAPAATPSSYPNYDVSPDGQRFLMLKPSEQTSSSSLTQIVVVENWFEELKQKVPTGEK